MKVKDKEALMAAMLAACPAQMRSALPREMLENNVSILEPTIDRLLQQAVINTMLTAMRHRYGPANCKCGYAWKPNGTETVEQWHAHVLLLALEGKKEVPVDSGTNTQRN